MSKVNCQKLIVKKGFTLIEILFVIIIIGIIASIILVMINTSKENSRVARLLKYGDSVRAQLSSYEVGWWRFEESGTNGTLGSVKDSWGGNNGTPTNITFSQSGVGKGNAFGFSGSSNVNFPGLNKNMPPPLTYSAWVKYPAITSGGKIIIYKTGQFLMRTNMSNIFCGEDNSGRGVVASVSLTTDQWHHIICVIKSGAAGNQFVYFDGANTGDIGNGFIPDSSYPDSLLIGSSFVGQIDEVQIWNSALTAMEVQRIYAESAPRHGIALK